jgi:small subunit ribosomal protein S7
MALKNQKKQIRLSKMSRKPYKRSPFAKPKEDMVYGSEKIRKFINCVMIDGKYVLSASIVYAAFDLLVQDIHGEVKGTDKKVEIVKNLFEDIIEKAMPLVEVKSKRIGGATYQVPVDIRGKRRLSLAYRWIITFARQRKGMPMVQRLYKELLDVYHKRGATIKKREDAHRMAAANRAFASKRVMA